jgi:hypothetical protein
VLISSQFIIKLLYKELNEAQRLAVPRATTLNKAANEPVLSSTWSKVTPKNPYDKRGPVNTKSLDPWPLPQTSNRYSVLSYLPESATKGDETIPSKSEVRNLGNKHRPRWWQPVPNKYETGSEQEREGKTDSVQRQIPTLVNGQVFISKKSDFRQCVNGKSSNAPSMLREASRRLLIKKINLPILARTKYY